MQDKLKAIVRAEAVKARRSKVRLEDTRPMFECWGEVERATVAGALREDEKQVLVAIATVVNELLDEAEHIAMIAHNEKRLKGGAK